MLVPQVVEERFGLSKNDKLVLVPLKTSRVYEVIKNIALVALCVLTCGLLNYFNPQLQDHIYYGLFHHRKLVKLHKDPFGVVALMNFPRFKNTLKDIGWQESCANLSQLVTKKRSLKLNLDERLRKMLHIFFLSIRQKHKVMVKAQPIKQIPNLSSEQGILNQIPYAFSLSPGAKQIMEDVIHVDHFDIHIKGANEKVSSFILMDGHGIQKTQEPINLYAKRCFLHHLRTYLNAYLREGFNFSAVYEAFKSTFEEINVNFPHQRSGTTFLGLFFINNLIFCVSIGDSKAYLIDPFLKLPVALTADPNHPYFQKKLEKKGARIITAGDSTRVEGLLNMATALGDKHIVTKEGQAAIKPSMSFIAIPRIWIQSPAFITLGSDGVFDFLSEEELEKIIRSSQSCEEKARQLLEAAFKNGSNDNLSSLLIKI
jgi:serine/threonine protein phosphatase PrpC